MGTTRRRRIATLGALALALSLLVSGSSARAQSPSCPPGTLVCVGPNGQVIVQTPKLEPPPVHVGGQAGGQVGGQMDARAQAEARARAEWEAKMAAEARRLAAWRVYFQWRARVRAEVEAQTRWRLRREYEARPNPYASMPAPVHVPARANVTYPRVELGLLTACFGAWTGPGGLEAHGGYCPPVRFRFDRDWSISLDPSVVAFDHPGVTFGAVGFHPALLYSFANGIREDRAAHAYWRIGLDAWLPFSKLEATPNLLGGGHVGLGVQLGGETVGMGAEVRAIVRTGLGDADGTPNQDIASTRFGVETRVTLLSIAF